MLGIKDILLKHPVELKLHKLAVVEKLRERIGDDDESVRETLYQLFKSVIFPGSTKDHQGPFVSLMMAYVFNAMAHLALDVRLMAFRFFDLVVQFYPSSFPFYAEKVNLVFFCFISQFDAYAFQPLCVCIFKEIFVLSN